LVKKRIGLIHATMNSVKPILEAFSKLDDDVELINFMDEGLVYELNETNKITNRMLIRLTELAGKAVESRVDAILFTCSSFSPYVSKIAGLIPVPVLSSDESMLKNAIDSERKIIVISTIKKAGPTTQKMLEEYAAAFDKNIDVEIHVLEEAFHALQSGNEEKHDRLIQDKINEQSTQDIIVLAQYSMARATEDIDDDRVLTAPNAGAQAIVKLSERAGTEGCDEN